MSIHRVAIRSHRGRRRSHLFMEGVGGYVAQFMSALGALLAWLTSRRKGSASFNVFLAIALVAICVVGWRLAANSTRPPSVAMPEGSPDLHDASATPPQELKLRTPAPASGLAASPTDEGDDGAQVAASRAEEPVLDEEAWRESFAEASVHELLAASKALRAEVEEKSGPIIDGMHAAGHSEYVGPEHVYEGRPDDNELIFRVYMEKGKGTYRMELPRAHYSEIYALKARALWLEDMAHKKKQG